MKIPTVKVIKIAVDQCGTRTLIIECPYCRTRGNWRSPPRAVTHTHGGGRTGQPLKHYAGSRLSHCAKDERDYELVIPDELVRLFGSEQERGAMKGAS